MATSVKKIPTQIKDDALTVCAVSLISAALANVLHEGVGHALVALFTGAQSGVISTVAWSSAYDSRLVAAGGTLVNLAAGLIFWLALRSSKNFSVQTRYFLLTSLAFNAFTGTGYFFFSGVTNFGDWQVVIAPLHPYWMWRTLLVVVGIAAYYCAILLVGSALVRYVGVPLDDPSRYRKVTFIPYFSAALLLGAGGLLNPIGIQLVWESALPGAAGADCGLLWMLYYIPKRTAPKWGSPAISRSYAWIIAAAVVSLAFVFVLGRGIPLRR
jgi:hypothetical protein